MNMSDGVRSIRLRKRACECYDLPSIIASDYWNPDGTRTHLPAPLVVIFLTRMDALERDVFVRQIEGFDDHSFRPLVSVPVAPQLCTVTSYYVRDIKELSKESHFC